MDTNKKYPKRKFTKFYKDEIPTILIQDCIQAFTLYFYLKHNAAFYDHKRTYKGKIVNLKKMELFTSLSDLSDVLKITKYKVSKNLQILQIKNMILVDTKEGFTRVKILEPVSKSVQTAKKRVIKGKTDDKLLNSQTVTSKFQTASNTVTEGISVNKNINVQTQYNNKIIVFKEKKIEVSQKEINKVDDLILFINNKFDFIENRVIELDKSNKDIRKQVSKLVQLYSSEQALKMEISRYFTRVSSADKYNINLGTLCLSLVELMSKKVEQS